jgi:hypothetical protein
VRRPHNQQSSEFEDAHGLERNSSSHDLQLERSPSPKVLPLEARRQLWTRLWDRLLQPCPHERSTQVDVEAELASATVQKFDAGRMAWRENEDGARSDDRR